MTKMDLVVFKNQSEQKYIGTKVDLTAKFNVKNLYYHYILH